MTGKKSKSKSRSIKKRQAVKVGGRAEYVSRMNRRQTDDYLEAVELFEKGDLPEAEEILLELNRKGTFLAVIELLSILFLEMDEFDKAALESRRLVRLAPDNADARFRYAMAAMYKSYATIAMVQFQELLQRSPSHREARKVEDLMQVLGEEVENRIQTAKFPTGSTGVRLQATHEESLLAMSNSRFEEAIERCQRVLAEAPEFCPARNNLALSNFHGGNLSQAIEIAEATVRLWPDNRFAAVQLAKFRFLSGNLERPEGLIAGLLANPPDNQDAAVTAAQWMAIAGYDEELVRFLCALPKSVLVDPVSQGMALHYEAYGRCRLGQTKEAKNLWKKSIRILPQGTTAQENLDELGSPVEHAIWPCSMEQWIPRSFVENLLRISKSKSSKHAAHSVPDYLKNLLPIFLDRGDPDLRQLAVALFVLDGTDASMQLLRQFALSTRGSDSIRYKALVVLKGRGLVDKGPHRFFSQGKFREVALLDMEIHYEPIPTDLSKESLKKMEAAIEAMRQGKFAVAERIFEELLVKHPENNSVRFNLASVWLQRDGKADEKKARAELESLHHRDPDYIFAGVGLAQMYCRDGDHNKAQELLQQYVGREQMHIAELKALYIVQAQIAKHQGKHDEAVSIVQALESLVDDDDPEVIALRQRIDTRSVVSRLAGLIKSR
jgi:tetratricopeptide (TPR) repeat protein